MRMARSSARLHINDSDVIMPNQQTEQFTATILSDASLC